MLNAVVRLQPASYHWTLCAEPVNEARQELLTWTGCYYLHFADEETFFLHFLTDQKWGWQFWGPLGSISVGWVFRLPCWSPMAILNLQCAREKEGRRERKGGRGEQESIQRERDEGGGGRGGVWSRPTASCLESRTQDCRGRPTGGGHMACSLPRPQLTVLLLKLSTRSVLVFLHGKDWIPRLKISLLISSSGWTLRTNLTHPISVPRRLCSLPSPSPQRASGKIRPPSDLGWNLQRVVSPHHSTDQNGSAVGEDEREPLGWLTSGSQEWAVGWESPAEFHRAAIVATEATLVLWLIHTCTH